MENRKRFLTVALSLSLLLLPFGVLQGAEQAGKLGLSLHPGLYKLGLTDHSDIWTLSGLANVQLKYGLSSKFALGVEGSWMQNYLATEEARTPDGAGLTTESVDGGPRQRGYVLGLVAEYHFMPEKAWSPYVFGGPGIYIWKWADPDWNTLFSNDPALAGTFVPPLDLAGNPYELKDKELYAMLGLGFEVFPVEALSFEVGGKVRYLTHFLTDFKDDQDIVGTGWDQLDLPKAVGEVYAGLTFYLGGRSKDTDGDGVSDKKDMCPATPLGCLVDIGGCPVDSDSDGVCDGLDQCRNTPRGALVDRVGCPTDSDGDGVFDGVDKCLTTPAGCQVDAAGCQTDADGDGVCDGVDKCPETAKGCKVDATGCPLDSDGDSVCDGLDRCPNTPAGTEVNELGCAIPKVEYVPPPEKPLVLKGVNFASNVDVLLESSKAILDDVAISLRAHPDVRVEIGGHCDATGPDDYNLELSGARARAVRDYLVGKGVDPANLTVRGYGETQPIASNATKAGRAENRRVELKRLP